ncbi:MAG: chemotaxis protein CheW, partial [Gemmatimonadota bacterium]
FALDVFEVHEVLDYEPPRSVPRAPDFVEGVLDVRDGVIPVVDMRARFDLEPTTPDDETRILVVALGDERIGLIVDAVSDVVHLSPEWVDEPPEYFRGLAEEYLAGIARPAGRVLLVLRVDRVLTTEQRLALVGEDEEPASTS